MTLLQQGKSASALLLLSELEKSLMRYLSEGQQNATVNRLAGLTLNNIGCYYRRVGKLKVALKKLFSALAIEVVSEECDFPAIAGTHLNICAILSSLNKHHEAASHANSALSLIQQAKTQKTTQKQEQQRNRSPISIEEDDADSNGDSYLSKTEAVCYYNLGIELEHLKEYTPSLSVFTKGWEVAKQNLSKDNTLYRKLREAMQRIQEIITKSEQRKGSLQVLPISSKEGHSIALDDNLHKYIHQNQHEWSFYLPKEFFANNNKSTRARYIPPRGASNNSIQQKQKRSVENKIKAPSKFPEGSKENLLRQQQRSPYPTSEDRFSHPYAKQLLDQQHPFKSQKINPNKKPAPIVVSNVNRLHSNQDNSNSSFDYQSEVFEYQQYTIDSNEHAGKENINPHQNSIKTRKGGNQSDLSITKKQKMCVSDRSPKTTTEKPSPTRQVESQIRDEDCLIELNPKSVRVNHNNTTNSNRQFRFNNNEPSNQQLQNQNDDITSAQSHCTCNHQQRNQPISVRSAAGITISTAAPSSGDTQTLNETLDVRKQAKLINIQPVSSMNSSPYSISSKSTSTGVNPIVNSVRASIRLPSLTGPLESPIYQPQAATCVNKQEKSKIDHFSSLAKSRLIPTEQVLEETVFATVLRRNQLNNAGLQFNRNMPHNRTTRYERAIHADLSKSPNKHTYGKETDALPQVDSMWTSKTRSISVGTVEVSQEMRDEIVPTKIGFNHDTLGQLKSRRIMDLKQFRQWQQPSDSKINEYLNGGETLPDMQQTPYVVLHPIKSVISGRRATSIPPVRRAKTETGGCISEEDEDIDAGDSATPSISYGDN